MKKIMILIAAIAMATLAAQASDVQPTATTIAMDTETPAPATTEGDTNQTEEEAPKK